MHRHCQKFCAPSIERLFLFLLKETLQLPWYYHFGNNDYESFPITVVIVLFLIVPMVVFWNHHSLFLLFLLCHVTIYMYINSRLIENI